MPTARKNLRAVKDGEKPPTTRKRKMTVTQAAASGSQRELLVAMRDRIARAVGDPSCPPRDLAALTRRLQDISEKIEALDLRAKEEGSDAGDIVEDEELSAEAF